MNQHIHLVGIGGTGMGPLAKIFLEMGHTVSGSDLQSSTTTDYLIDLGATIYFRHAAANVNGATSVVYSSAIPPENPEVLAARQKGVKVLHRSEVLAELLNSNRGIAVAGAHGKTTITSMLALCLEKAGLDPTVLIGAHFTPFGPGAKHGKGQFVVAEADESDGSFLRYRPEVAVVTSIEPDHLENYNGTFEALVASYRQFLDNCPPKSFLLLGIDDKIVADFSREYECTTYGFSRAADWRAQVVKLWENKSRFKVYYRNEFFGDFELIVPGRHNISNALACIAAGHYAGLSAPEMRAALASFSGAKRRFEILGKRQGAVVVDDYAHHPTEVAATIKAAQEGWDRRVIAIFQPHRYSRTKLLLEDFARSFQGADVVILTNIYAPPPEQPIPNVSSAILAEKIRGQKGPAEVYHIPRQEDVASFLLPRLTANDLVLVMGAGPIWRVARDLLT
ncbi:MAG TPA: UDP-N-acetylmuramate--L-alanine ligase [Firmicutes bacterium]|nr:UDP-N-acetylmuramate--L-alanine ligase [Bacillota bacterium]